MSLLAAPIQLDDPPPAYLQSVPGSFLVKNLGWCGLTLGTREGYCMFTVISIEGGGIRQDEMDEVGHSGWDE